MLISAISWLLTPQLASAIVYSFIDGAAGDQSGHKLSGFVTFNTPCGTSCTGDNITDFSFVVAGSLNYSHAYTDPSDIFVVNGLGHLNVSPTSIALNKNVTGQLALGNASTGGYPYVQWVGGVNNVYRSVAPDLTWTWYTNATSSIIATAVPEPTTLTLFLAALLAQCARRLARSL